MFIQFNSFIPHSSKLLDWALEGVIRTPHLSSCNTGERGSSKLSIKEEVPFIEVAYFSHPGFIQSRDPYLSLDSFNI